LGEWLSFSTAVRDIVAYSYEGSCNEVCTWLDADDGSKVVAEYRRAIGGKDAIRKAESVASPG
jgi:hypothetical protein